MAFTRDYSILTPIDHTLIAQGPTAIRNVKQDVQDRLATIISGFTSGETVLGVLNLPFIAVSAPSTVTDQFQLYGKEVGGKTELHGKDEDGNEIQITTAGKLNAGALGGTLASTIQTALLQAVYPVGSIYINVSDPTNPATLLGFGTWAALGAGRMIVGYDSGDANFDSAGETGGANTVTLTTNELPAHTHTMAPDGNDGTVGGDYISGTNAGPVSHSSTTSTGSAGSGAAFSVLNKYVTCYTWKRTA